MIVIYELKKLPVFNLWYHLGNVDRDFLCNVILLYFIFSAARSRSSVFFFFFSSLQEKSLSNTSTLPSFSFWRIHLNVNHWFWPYSKLCNDVVCRYLTRNDYLQFIRSHLISYVIVNAPLYYSPMSSSSLIHYIS